jgi:hypothetical protein
MKTRRPNGIGELVNRNKKDADFRNQFTFSFSSKNLPVLRIPQNEMLQLSLEIFFILFLYLAKTLHS